MGTIPDGLAPHVLYNMDGRQWIENWYAAGFDTTDEKKKKLLEMKIERGWVKIIPQEKLAEFINSL